MCLQQQILCAVKFMLKWRKDGEWAEDGILSMLAVLLQVSKQYQVNF